MLNSICANTAGSWIGWAANDGSIALLGNTFLPSQDTFVHITTIPQPIEEIAKVVEESIVASSAGVDSIVFSIVEKPVTIMEDLMVSDTLLRSNMDMKWAVIAQEAITLSNGLDSLVPVDGWVLYNNNLPVDTLAYASNDLNRISLNMYVDYVTSGRFSNFNLEYILGIIMSPIAWILGTPSQDVLIVGQLLGKKTILNEFVAYADIPSVTSFISFKSKIILTYALCGFANFASIGIQLGGIGAIAPSKKTTLAKFGVKALVGGTIACFLTATIAGMLVG